MVASSLLDVNVLIALHSPAHGSHKAVRRWFKSRSAKNFATCAITESGFIRVSAQISAEVNVGMEEAKFALAALTALRGHIFLQSVGFLQATQSFESNIRGHRQITDAYLLGLAIHHKGRLATLDRGILHLAGTEFRDHVELIA